MDGPGDGTEEAETLLQVPDVGTRKRVPFQRLRLQTETLGTGAQSQFDGEAGEDMVSEQEDEEQEEQPAAAGRSRQQQFE